MLSWHGSVNEVFARRPGALTRRAENAPKRSGVVIANLRSFVALQSVNRHAPIVPPIASVFGFDVRPDGSRWYGMHTGQGEAETTVREPCRPLQSAIDARFRSAEASSYYANI
jgi:hypothetical protein